MTEGRRKGRQKQDAGDWISMTSDAKAEARERKKKYGRFVAGEK